MSFNLQLAEEEFPLFSETRPSNWASFINSGVFSITNENMIRTEKASRIIRVTYT